MLQPRLEKLFSSRHSKIMPLSRKMNHAKNAENCANDIFSAINKYTWTHGIGFEKGTNFSRKYIVMTAISIIFAIILEANAVYFLSVSLMKFTKSDAIVSKGQLADITIVVFACLNRMLLYAKRKPLLSISRKLAKIYAKVCSDEIPLKQFRWKLIFILFIADVIHYIYTVYIAYKYFLKLKANKTAYYGFIPPPYSFLLFYISVFLLFVGSIEVAVSTYFCSACFVLKESLRAIKEKLQCVNCEDVELLSEMYMEIRILILKINALIHPCLLATIMQLLSRAFQKFYYAVYIDGDLPIITKIYCIFKMFFVFVCICLFNSSLLNAASHIKITAQKLCLKNSNNSHLVASFKEDIEGFKLLDFIFLSKSLIFSVIGNFLTYGILLSTFSANSVASGSKQS